MVDPCDARVSNGPDTADPGECGAVLDVLSAQLGQTARVVEASVTQVCHSFTSIVRRTKTNAAHTARAADHAGGGDGDALTTARSTIARLLGRMDQVRRAAEESVEALHRIEAIATRVDLIQLSLKKVDAVANALGILAINAKIEAARAGDQGRAFGVVAAETGEVAKAIRSASESVRAMVDALWQDVSDGTRRMRAGLLKDQTAAELSRAADLSQEEGLLALEALTRDHTNMQGLVAEAAANSKQLGQDIEDAMTSLQFQDAVNQQIEHVMTGLQDVRAALATGNPARTADLLERLRERTTMQSERQLLDGITNGESKGIAQGSIELF